MSPTPIYRIVAVLLVLFAAGHTLGFMGFKPPTPESAAVRDAMNMVQFEFKGANYSFGNFYIGFGLTITAYLLFAAFLSWHLGTLASAHPQSIGALGWAFAIVQGACLVLSLRYFFLLPAILSGVVVLGLVWAAWLVNNAGA